MFTRPIVRIAMVAAGVGIAQLVWMFADLKSIVYLAGLAQPACLLCVSGVWAMRGKADDFMPLDEAKADAIEKLRAKADEIRARSMRMTVGLGVAAVLAGGPMLSHLLFSTVWQWMVLVTGAAIAHCGYGYLVAAEWEKQLRDFKTLWLLSQRRRQEQDTLVDRIISGHTLAKGPLGSTDSVDKLHPI